MAKKKEKPLTREDVLRLVEENGGKAEGIELSNCKFVDVIDLSNLDLSGIVLNNARLFRANFNGSNLDRAIMQKAYLGYAIFNRLNSRIASLQGVDLRWANLHDAEFREADLSAAQFQETPFQGVVHPPELQGKLLELLPASLDRTDFRGANLFRANFKGCYFYSTKLEGASIRGADILEAHLEETDWGNYIIGEEKKKEELHFAGDVYRRLKIWYNRAGRYDIAGKFFFREQESYRKLVQFAKPRRIKQFWMLVWLWVFRLTCGYGEKPLRVGILAAIVIFGSALSYWGGGMDVLYSLYFSAVSFTALGYGSWVYPPSALWMQTVGAIESFFGISIMALFLVTFIRKMSR
ncbi:MAG: pentapeptide repeat-containing protein [Dehalococcoidales bacterium]